MTLNASFGRAVRLRRLYHHGDDRLFIVPLDHSLTDGPITGGAQLNHMVGELARNGVDAIVLHKGNLAHLDPDSFANTSLVVHLSASTRHAPDPNAKYLVGTVEECLRLGADAVSTHINVGSAGEARQVADLALVAEACDRWNMPLIAMMYVRGENIANPRDPELLSHAATLAVDLGADIVKSVYPGTVSEMADVVRSCPVPIIVAGGAPLSSQDMLEEQVRDVLRSGARGVAMGRNVFQAPNPGWTARRITDVIHNGFDEISFSAGAYSNPDSATFETRAGDREAMA